MGTRHQREEKLLGSDAVAETAAMPSGFIVRRERLLRDLATRGREAGISILCAPTGFGKTAVLLQYVAEVRGDVLRGMAQLVDAASLGADGLLRALRRTEEELEVRRHPLIAIDNMPILGPEGVEVIASLLRELRSRGFEIVVACRPNNRAFVHAMGDSFKLGAQALKVYPREYSEWAHAFSLSGELDVYALTQGVPSLVALLRAATRKSRVSDALAAGVVKLYRSVLQDLRRDRDPLYRLACLFVLVGHGALADLERCGMRIRSTTISRLARDYPVFGLDTEANAFCSLGGDSAACDRLRKDIAKRRPAFAHKAARILVGAGHIDRAVHLAGLLLDAQGCLDLIDYSPAVFALSGNALFVHSTVASLTGDDALRVPAGVELALYLCSLTMGEYRLARSTCSDLCRRAAELPDDINPDVWVAAEALSDLWCDCAKIELPRLPGEYAHGAKSSAAQRLQLHRRIYRALLEGDGVLDADAFPEPVTLEEGEVDIPGLLLECDRLLDAALHGELADAAETDARLQDEIERLSARRLVPLAARVRMTAATCRILCGLPLVDERAFTDAGTVAIRESDTVTQLFCLLGEGWQSLDVGQVANARFRAQQVLKLADNRNVFLQSWAQVLERVAFILNTSRIGICDEAELLDLSQGACSPVDAWIVALMLSAAHYDSELSAWYSIHKTELLDARFRPLARLAMAAIGERANSMTRLLPARVMTGYLFAPTGPSAGDLPFEPEGLRDQLDMGQVNINLFGGFMVQRNGHTLTNGVWRRKKASVLAARLVLALGSFVSRQLITEELWPGLEYPRARENLYVTISSLRSALGQQGSGPQYVLAQGDGIALNAEYVCSDIVRFDMLAREILLRRSGTSARQIIESCLKIEQLYTGPLYAPEVGSPTFFLRMRRAYQSKFIDCMLRGIETAIEIDDIPSASWLVEAALRQAPLREDVIRCAMHIYDRAGRRREVVELYNSHLHYLDRELKALPEEETRLAYESIINRSQLKSIV